MDSTKVYAATVDLGNNVSSLLQKLADKIGITVDKIFPYYVKQAKIEGYTILITVLTIFTLLITTEIILRTKNRKFRAKIKQEDRYLYRDTSILEGFEIANVICLAVIVIVGVISIQYIFGHIANPEYYAMQNLIGSVHY
jgi:hypothetical protein